MPFLKETVAPNGVTLRFHRTLRIEIGKEMTHLTAHIGGWPSEAAYLSGQQAAWVNMETVPLVPEILALCDAALLGTELLAGAVSTPDQAADLATIKLRKNAELNAARLRANRSGFEFAGKVIASDELSRSDIDAVAAIVARTQALPAGWPGAWKAVDNSYVPIPDTATWDAFYAAMYQTGLANFSRAQNLKAQVAAATTAAEVEAITWESALTGA